MTMQHQARVEALLTQIRDAVVEPPRPSKAQATEQVIIQRVRVVTAGSAIQGPDIPVPAGFSIVVRQRRHAGAPTGYVAFSRNAVSNTTSRVEMADNDSISVLINNFKEAWFDATIANTDFEMIAVR